MNFENGKSEVKFDVICTLFRSTHWSLISDFHFTIFNHTRQCKKSRFATFFFMRILKLFFRQQTHPLYLYVFDLWFSKNVVHKKKESSKGAHTHTLLLSWNNTNTYADVLFMRYIKSHVRYRDFWLINFQRLTRTAWNFYEKAKSLKLWNLLLLSEENIGKN